MDAIGIAFGLDQTTGIRAALEIEVPELGPHFVAATFLVCDGIGTREPSALRGRGLLTLKQGLSTGLDLRKWFEAAREKPNLCATAALVLYDAEETPARFVLSRCKPVKLDAWPSGRKTSATAVAELHFTFESARRDAREGASPLQLTQRRGSAPSPHPTKGLCPFTPPGLLALDPARVSGP